MHTSNEALIASIDGWDPEEIYGLIELLHSRLSPSSRRLLARYGSAEDVPAPATQQRQQLAEELAGLLGWYGANAFAYGGRYVWRRDGAAAYITILRDVAHWAEKQRPRKKRRGVPRLAAAEELEWFIIESLFDHCMANLSPDKMLQILTESGMDQDAAWDALRRYGLGGTAGALTPQLLRAIGKRTFTNVLEQMMISFTSPYLTKQGAEQLGRRIFTRWSQKTFLGLGIGLSWSVFAGEVIMFASSPARRITCKAVPYIAMVRAARRLRDATED